MSSNKETTPAEQQNNEGLFKKIFFISLIAMLGTLWICGYDTPFHSDEMDMNVYAKNNIAFYTSGGTDTSYLYIDYHEAIPANSMLKYYTCGFDYLAVAVNTLLGNADGYEFNIRHALNQLFAVLAILFAGLIARLLVNYRAGVITIWLLFLTPIFFGLALFDTKDIPFSTGYVASLYFILLFLKELPKINKRVLAGLIISIAFACSVRIAGLLLIAYLVGFVLVFLVQNKGILKQKQYIQRIAGAIALTIAIVLILTILGWPYVLTSPVEHFKQALNVARDFPQSIPLNFDGEYIDSLNVPKSYFFVYFTRTVPVLILLAFCSAIALIYTKRKQVYINGIGLVLFAAIFPVFYAIIKDVSLYNSWRHLLFIYPPFIAITGIGTELLIQQLKKPIYRYATLAVLIVGMMHPIIWIAKSHPCQYMYYNEPAGGFKNNYYTYETDYWQMSTREALDWLIEHENILDAKDTITIATNSISVFGYYIDRCYPEAKIKFINIGYNKRMRRDWTYGIFSNLFLPPYSLENHFPPNENLIHLVNVDEMPVTAVIKDTTRYDYIAQELYYENRLEEADSVFNLLREQHKGHIDEHFKPLLGLMAFTKAGVDQYDLAKYYAEQSIAYDEFNYEGNIVLGIIYYYEQDYVKARKYLNMALQINPNDAQATQFLNNIMSRMQ